MAGNAAGYVCPFDGGNPRIITGKAIEAVSGGWLVIASGASNTVSSGLNSFVADDIWIAKGASGLAFNGVAIENVESGTYVGVATAGLVIMNADGTVTAGYTVIASEGNDTVQVGTTAGKVIGRAWTNAASGGYALIQLGGV